MATITILFITVRSDHGGGPRHVDLLINNLSPEFKVYVACPNDKPYYDLWKSNKKVQILFQLPHRKLEVRRLIELSKFIQNNEIAIVHSHGKGAGVYSRLLKILNPKLKVIHTFHGVHTQEYGPLAKKAYYLYENLAKRLTEKFINVSFGERDICLSGGFCDKKQQHTIYNGVPDVSTLADHQLKLPSQKFKVVTISRFDYSKHMQLAYEIAKQLKDKLSIEFVWVGDGPDKAALEKKAKEEGLTNILFTGFTDQPEQYLRTAQAYLSTSRWEGLPLALIEAGTFSLPIVATDVTGNNEVVQHGVNGYLFNAANHQEAAKYIFELSNDSITYQAFSLKSREVYKQKFTVEAMISKTESLYFS